LPRDKTKFKQELAGRNTSSLGKRYTYTILGILDKIKNIRPCRSAIIINNEDHAKLIELMDKYKVKHKSYPTKVSKSEFKK